MKEVGIGILAFHFANNFGAVLQSYALQKTLNDLNVKNEIIDFRPYKMINQTYIFPRIFTSIKNLGSIGGIKDTILKLYYFRFSSISSTIKFNDFRNSHFKLSSNISFSIEDFKQALNYTKIIVGSDQVWNTKITNSNQEAYFLGFVEKSVEKYSYAASFGTDVDTIISENPDIISYLKNYKYISVRESSSQMNLLNYGFNPRNLNHHLDPTFLIKKESYRELAKSAKHIKPGYILVYNIEASNLIIDFANTISKKLNLRLITYNESNRFLFNSQSFKNAGPLEFINLIESADCVISSSYHGIIFSIIFEKDFYAIPHSNYPYRAIDLLKELNLETRVISNIKDLKSLERINYEMVNKELEVKILKSIEYLTTITREINDDNS